MLWWYRNKVGGNCFAIQGFRRNRIFPDFVVQGEHDGRTMHRVLVIETKGAHIKDNPDTLYKRNVASFFERAGKKVSWHQLGEPFKDHLFRFQVIDESQTHGRLWQDAVLDLLHA